MQIINIEKKQHPLYIPLYKLRNPTREKNRAFSRIGKWQYIYSNKKEQISLIKIINHYHNNRDVWEIHNTKGDLFEDIEIFKSKKEAEKRIFSLLQGWLNVV